MRFSQLHMQNFRGIRNLDIAFEPDMTVIIGRNGAGKTSVLDALASFMELILVSIKGMNTRTTHSSISLEDVRFETKSLSLQVQLQIEDEGSKSIQQHELKIEFDGGPTLPIRLMRDVFQKLPKEIGPTLNYIYYRQNRVFATESTTDRNDPERVSIRISFDMISWTKSFERSAICKHGGIDAMHRKPAWCETRIQAIVTLNSKRFAILSGKLTVSKTLPILQLNPDKACILSRTTTRRCM